MKLPAFFTKLGGLTAAKTVHAWMSTLDYRVAYYDRSIDPVTDAYQGEKIYIFWHEFILFPLYLRGHCDFAMLLSQHRDGDILARAAYHLGFDCVRGSTYRGASTAIREMLRRGRNTNLTITPDGPRGPRRQLAQGPIYLASKLGLPLVPMGFGYDRPWRLGSWDRFAIPRPHSQARAVVGPPLPIPANLDRDGVEHYRQQVDHLLNWLTLEAESWAESRSRMVGEVSVTKQTRPKQPVSIGRRQSRTTVPVTRPTGVRQAA